MDQRIIKAMKRHARRDLLTQIICSLENRAELRALGNLKKPGMRDWKYGHPAHVLDAIQIVQRALKHLTKIQVANCWVKSEILSSNHITEICSTFSKSRFKKLAMTPGIEAEEINQETNLASREVDMEIDDTDRVND